MDIIEKIPITKGWSLDKKYKIITQEGHRYLMRLSPPELFDKLQLLYKYQRQIDITVRMCRPIQIGLVDHYSYIIQDWIDGLDLEACINDYDLETQYQLGFQAGLMLEKIHSVKLSHEIEDWSSRYNRKIDTKLKLYHEGNYHYDKDTYFISVIESKRHLIKDRPLVFKRGDFHIGNMMIQDLNVVIIDFDRFDFGDPWEEFNRIVWSAQKAPKFAKGIIDGYFHHQVPQEFWDLLLLYISNNMLSSFPWAQDDPEQLDIMIRQANQVLEWYDYMNTTIPKWYQ